MGKLEAIFDRSKVNQLRLFWVCLNTKPYKNGLCRAATWINWLKNLSVCGQIAEIFKRIGY